MNALPKVSIMIPTYNQSEYIIQAVQSAIDQDYSNKEIFVSDDSTDNQTEKLLKHFAEKGVIKYYKNTPRLGRVGNYYHSLREYATGDWVLNLDGDDYLFNNSFITKTMKMINENHDLSMVFGKEKAYHMQRNEYEDRPSGLSSNQIFDGNTLFFKKRELEINFYHLSTIYNRLKAIEVGFYENDCLGTDTISLMKLLVNNKVGFLNEYAGAWRIHDSNDSFTENLDTLISNVKELYSLKPFLINNRFEIKLVDRWLDKTVINRVLIYEIHFLSKRKVKLAFKLLKKIRMINSRLYYKFITDLKIIGKLILILVSSKKN